MEFDIITREGIFLPEAISYISLDRYSYIYESLHDEILDHMEIL